MRRRKIPWQTAREGGHRPPSLAVKNPIKILKKMVDEYYILLYNENIKGWYTY